MKGQACLLLCGQEQRAGLTAGAVSIWRRSTTVGLLLPPLPKSLPPLLWSTSSSPEQQQTQPITALSTHENAEEQRTAWATAAPLTTSVQHTPTTALGHALTVHWLHTPAAVSLPPTVQTRSCPIQAVADVGRTASVTFPSGDGPQVQHTLG